MFAYLASGEHLFLEVMGGLHILVLCKGILIFCLWKAFVPLSRYDIEGTTQTVGSLSLHKRTRFPSGNQFVSVCCLSGSPGNHKHPRCPESFQKASRSYPKQHRTKRTSASCSRLTIAKGTLNSRDGPTSRSHAQLWTSPVSHSSHVQQMCSITRQLECFMLIGFLDVY